MMGIYCLVFPGTNKVYIGRSTNIAAREYSHLYCMKKGKCSKKLQEAYNIYGKPVCKVIFQTEDHEVLYTAEKKYIKEFDSIVNGFNSSPGGEAGALLPGELNGRSLFSNEVYCEILELLVNTSFTIKKIADITNTTTSIVSKISSGEGHKWLKEACPEAYARLILKRANRSVYMLDKYASNRKYNYVYSPENIRYSLDGVKLVDFCTKHNLTESKLSKLLNGNSKEYLGWYTEELPVKYKPPIKVVSPEGDIYEAIYGKYSELAKKHGLDPAAFRRVLTGEARHHHGWKLYKEN